MYPRIGSSKSSKDNRIWWSVTRWETKMVEAESKSRCWLHRRDRYRTSERATNCFTFSSCARKDFTISPAKIPWWFDLYRLEYLINRESVLRQFIAKIYISPLSVLALYHIPVIYDTEFLLPVKRRETLMRQFIRGLREIARAIYFKDLESSGRDFQNDKFIYRVDNFRLQLF